MTNKRRITRPKLLSHTRPVLVKKPTTLPSKATRSLIRNHHTLQKQLSSALVRNDATTAATLQAQLSAAGGLEKYQEASIQGQSRERGGDSSRVLMQWLDELLLNNNLARRARGSKFRMLEVGALRTDNACSRSVFFEVTRIDLHSQHPDIEAQDFMQRPIPHAAELSREGFDVVSLSLVVNYVGDGAGRGEMLKRVSSFLRTTPAGSDDEEAVAMPSLFLVLPAPCVSNSRYLDEERLEGIMLSLGYKRVRRKMSAKLVYYLWRYDEALTVEGQRFGKEEIRKGGSRNNFAVVVM
jgi:25S rRNA (adenine2142-N1)-methyltransferase